MRQHIAVCFMINIPLLMMGSERVVDLAQNVFHSEGERLRALQRPENLAAECARKGIDFMAQLLLHEWIRDNGSEFYKKIYANFVALLFEMIPTPSGRIQYLSQHVPQVELQRYLQSEIINYHLLAIDRVLAANRCPVAPSPADTRGSSSSFVDYPHKSDRELQSTLRILRSVYDFQVRTLQDRTQPDRVTHSHESQQALLEKFAQERRKYQEEIAQLKKQNQELLKLVERADSKDAQLDQQQQEIEKLKRVLQETEENVTTFKSLLQENNHTKS